MLVFDPVAGGEALLVLDIGSKVLALAVFKDPATSAPRLACGTDDGKSARLRCGFWRRRAARARRRDRNTAFVNALVVFEDLATGALRLASGSNDYKVRVFDPVAGGEALVVLEGHICEC